jgi:GNAT superfamily N-acetyltransferase
MDTLSKPRHRAGSHYLGYHGRPPPSRKHHPAKKPAALPEGELIATRDGRGLMLRSIHADDVDALRRGFSGLTAEEVRMRFLHPMTELPEALAHALCDLDPDVAIAFVLVDPPGAGTATLAGRAGLPDDAAPEIHAVARAYIDPVTLAAEFALVVQHRYAGQGLGTLLMQRLIAACRARDAVEIWGDVLAENGAMLELCDHLGFSRHSAFQDPGVVRVTLTL